VNQSRLDLHQPEPHTCEQNHEFSYIVEMESGSEFILPHLSVPNGLIPYRVWKYEKSERMNHCLRCGYKSCFVFVSTRVQIRS
jgi:hypothetical protein